MRCRGCREEVTGVVVIHTVRRNGMVNDKGYVIDVMPPDETEVAGNVTQDMVSKVECESCGHDLTKLIKFG